MVNSKYNKRFKFTENIYIYIYSFKFHKKWSVKDGQNYPCAFQISYCEYNFTLYYILFFC